MLKEIKKYYDNGNLSAHYFIDDYDNFHGLGRFYNESNHTLGKIIYNKGVLKSSQLWLGNRLLSVFIKNGIRIELNY